MRASQTPTIRPNFAAVQEYVSNNPEIAVEYLAALVQENFQKHQPRGVAGRLSNLYGHTADACAGRNRARELRFQSNLRKREPVIGHVLTCSDPLLDHFFEGSAGFFAFSRRLGAWVGKSEADRESFAAEVALFRSMGAPLGIVVKHFDSRLVTAKNEALCDCGCAAISAVTTVLLEKEAGKTASRANTQSDAKSRWIDGMAEIAQNALYNPLRSRYDGFRGLQVYVRREILRETTELFKQCCAAGLPEGVAPQPVISCVIDQGTGRLLMRSKESSEVPDSKGFEIVKPKRTLRQIEDHLNRIAMGKAPQSPAVRQDATAHS